MENYKRIKRMKMDYMEKGYWTESELGKSKQCCTNI